jgi:hypothetical protein
MKVLKLGKISLDGTKIKANTSKHRALSWEYACKLEINSRVTLKTSYDKLKKPTGRIFPTAWIFLMNWRVAKSAIAEAKTEIERRASKRFVEEQADYEKKLVTRKDKEQKTGKKARGKEPKPPVADPYNKDQVNLTDKESRIMPTSGGSFEQCYNVQASVDIDTMLIVGQHLTQSPNDKKEIKPALKALNELPEEL